MSTENDIRQKSEINPKNKEIYLSAPKFIFFQFFSVIFVSLNHVSLTVLRSHVRWISCDCSLLLDTLQCSFLQLYSQSLKTSEKFQCFIQTWNIICTYFCRDNKQPGGGRGVFSQVAASFNATCTFKSCSCPLVWC